MAEKLRYNKIIDLLEHDKPVFSTSAVPNGSLDDLTYVADADYDAVIIEMEHEGFSFSTLRTSLQVLLNRKRIAGTHSGEQSRETQDGNGDDRDRNRAAPVQRCAYCHTAPRAACRRMPERRSRAP